MSEEIAVVEVTSTPATEAIAEEIADKVQEIISEEEDDEKWVRDLFESAINPLREAVTNLSSQISSLLPNLPNQEQMTRMMEMLTNLAQTTIIANTPTPTITPEAEPVIVVTEPEPELEPANVEDAEKVPETKPVKKHRRI